MLGPGFRRQLLLLAATALAALVAATFAPAAMAGPRVPCNPPAFAGNVGAHVSGCARKPPTVGGRRGPPGRPGVRGAPGKKGTSGKTGARGQIGLTGALGPQGLPGAQGQPGPAGPEGAAGADGSQGDAGADGAEGAQGEVGADGPEGLQGVEGEVGAAGPTGDTGAEGPAGPAGADGADGAQGPAGAEGAQGPAGADGAQGPAGATSAGLSEYGYVYNVAAQTVPIEADIVFSSNGVLSPGIAHSPGTSAIEVVTAGTYKVSFSVSGVEPNQMALFVNDAVVVPGSVYGSGAGTQPNTGQTMIVLGAGDVLTLRNHSSAAAVILQTLAGGTQTNVNASVIIETLD